MKQTDNHGESAGSGSIPGTELILNPDGSIYHLNLLPADIARHIILAGDPGRVEIISSFFDTVEVRKQRREFVTHTGRYNGVRITALSSGIGTDNIDIVINELDALANIDLATRKPKKEHTRLNIVRIGTSGSLQADIPVDAFVLSELAVGFDGLLNFYGGADKICDQGFEKAFTEHVGWNSRLAAPYVVSASERLLKKFTAESKYRDKFIPGVTISAPGFYGPQGRELRLKPVDPGINDKIEKFRYGRHKITNYEMECSAIYGLSKLLGHDALTVCAIIANRASKTSSTRHEETMSDLIVSVLDTITG
ncbi:MAG: phosphorylase [Marinilabiliales bacterium]|nr:MAG: phosphorylase [Marinilabiliales bacterium]